MMRRLIFIISMFFCISASAQINDGLTFIYINHTNDTPIQDLCKQLNAEFKTAKMLKSPLIVYLANGKNPYVASVGIDGVKQDEYDNIIRALQEARYHPVDPRADVLNIIEIFNDHDFLNEYGVPKYGSMTWQFYIDHEFWQANYNEHIIAKLYFVLGLDMLPNDYLHLKLFYSGDSEFDYDLDNPFGLKNLCANLVNFEFLYY